MRQNALCKIDLWSPKPHVEGHGKGIKLIYNWIAATAVMHEWLMAKIRDITS